MNNQRLRILHVDMDAFYASIEQRDHPELRGKPVIVGGSKGSRGVVSTCSYEAREYGVHSAMPSVTAHRLCPNGIYLPVRMSHYAAVGQQIREIFHEYTPTVEPLSLDEAFLDVGGCEGLFGSAESIGHQIQDRIWNELQLRASVGVAPNKFLAKLGSDLRKPHGFVVIPSEQVQSLLFPLSVSRLPGVGAKGQQRLAKLGLNTIGDIAALSQDVMRDSFGKSGEYLWKLSHGLDDRAVIPDCHAKSISSETTFAKDIADRDVLRIWFSSLTDQVAARLRSHEYLAKTVDLKIRSGDFTTHTRSLSLIDATNVTEMLWQAVQELFEERVPSTWLPVRLVGVGATGLSHGTKMQGDLFEEEWRAKQRSLDTTLDAIRQQFGKAAVIRAGQIKKK